MSQDKKYTAKEAAYAVLKKAHDLLLKSEAEKHPGKEFASEEKDQTPPDGVQHNNPDAQLIDGNQPQSLGEKVNKVVEEHLAEHGQKAETQGEKEDDSKGHIKLAKFMGRMEAKREGKDSEPEQKEESTKEEMNKALGGSELQKPNIRPEMASAKKFKAGEPNKELAGTSIGQGESLRAGKPLQAKKEAKMALAHERSIPKPNLTKKEDASKMSGKSGMVRTDTAANQNQKGVNQHGYKGSSGGISEAGANLRDSKYGLKNGKENAVAIHKETLKDIKSMPKPNLTKKVK